MRHFLVAGIDFGTSYTKVYIEDQFTELAKAVVFGTDGKALLPSFVKVDGNRITGPLEESDGFRVAYLKLLIADETRKSKEFSALYDSAESRRTSGTTLLTGYLLSVIEGIHEFIRKDRDWSGFRRGVDSLVLQLAVPSGLYGGSSKVEDRMLECLKAAFLLSESTGHNTELNTITTIEQSIAGLATLPDDEASDLAKRCMIYPEVAAGVQTILRSKNYPEGKYVTMDVGAGTVDLNFFFRHKARPGDSESRNSLDTWSSLVVPLGCARLPVLHPAAGAHEKADQGMTEPEVRTRLKEAICELLRRTFLIQPRRVDGNGPDVYHHGMRAFIFGGGAAVPLYREILSETLRELDVRVPEVANLPPPGERFDLPRDIDGFGRLAVAFGLSRHRINLDAVRLPEEIEEIFKRYRREATSTDDREEIGCSCNANPDCPRCFGTGLISGRRLLPNLEAIELWKSQRTLSRKPVSTGVMTEEAKILSKWLDDYWKIKDMADIVARYLILKRIEALLDLIQASPRNHFRNDAFKYFEEAHNRPWQSVTVVSRSAVRTSTGFLAEVHLPSKHGMVSSIITFASQEAVQLMDYINGSPDVNEVIVCKISLRTRGDGLSYLRMIAISKETHVRKLEIAKKRSKLRLPNYVRKKRR